MSENVPAPADPLLADLPSPLTGLRLAEERACTGYLAARKAQMRIAARLASLHQMVIEQPRRTDYRCALSEAASRYQDAKQRTATAFERWREALHRSDLAWQDTEGRRPRTGRAA